MLYPCILCIHIYTHSHVSTCTHTHTRTHAYTYTSILTHLCNNVYEIKILIPWFRTHVHACTPRVHTHICTHTHSYARTHTRNTYVYARTRTVARTHAHMAYIHTHSRLMLQTSNLCKSNFQNQNRGVVVSNDYNTSTNLLICYTSSNMFICGFWRRLFYVRSFDIGGGCFTLPRFV